jgi:hypothetical protein
MRYWLEAHYRRFYFAYMPDALAPEAFRCSYCGTSYKLVRAKAGEITKHYEITCLSCGGPLTGREGAFVLKYFLVDKPRQRQDRRA